jgi:hypothetical protein
VLKVLPTVLVAVLPLADVVVAEDVVAALVVAAVL